LSWLLVKGGYTVLLIFETIWNDLGFGFFFFLLQKVKIFPPFKERGSAKRFLKFFNFLLNF